MTPAERETVFAGRIVGNLDDLPADVRDRFMENGRRVSRELHSAAEWLSDDKFASPTSSSIVLDVRLPQERSADGMSSAADFLLHEMPKIIDALAADYLAATLPVDGPASSSRG